MSRGSRREVAVDVHPPERRRARGLLASTTFCTCCCSCCCCLHSLGGLIGGARASGKGPPTPARSRANRTYWWTVLALAILNGFLPWAGEVGGLNLILVAILLPGIQIAAAFVACGLLFFSSLEDKRAAYRHVGRIALYSFGGAFIGTAIMVALAGLAQLAR
jgi:hypothetical protein